MTITVTRNPYPNQYVLEVETDKGVRDVFVIGSWPVVVAAMRAYVETLT